MTTNILQQNGATNLQAQLFKYKTTNTDINGNKLNLGAFQRWVVNFGFPYRQTDIGGNWKVYRGGEVTQIKDATWKPTRRGTGQ